MKNNNDELIKYCLKHSSDLTEEEARIYKETQLRAYNPGMCSSPIQGRLLRILSILKQPNRILEIGSFTGFSTICLAAGLNENGKIITIENDEENFAVANKNYSASTYASKIESLLGDAVEEIPKLLGTFDLIFIDAAKKFYIDFYNLIIDKIKPGGFILVDNVTWFEKVLDDIKDPTTQAIHDFNVMVNNDPRVTQLILPFEDGLQLIVRK